MREHLTKIDPGNLKSLEEVESAILVLSLTDENISDATDVSGNLVFVPQSFWQS